MLERGFEQILRKKLKLTMLAGAAMMFSGLALALLMVVGTVESTLLLNTVSIVISTLGSALGYYGLWGLITLERGRSSKVLD
ncbi:MAG: hypothetical protein DRO01_03935 [Thermoproteota archaeon]|nr:MAG: hypothetical protein DRO01_03935 [Candidatus Korarchaeota archaeon]